MMSDREPRPYTKEELTKLFVDGARDIAQYWAELPEKDKYTGRVHTNEVRCMGVVHSMLCMLDGVDGSMPCGFDLIPSTHPDDKKSRQEEGENWVEIPNDEESKTVSRHALTEGMLHDMLYPKRTPEPAAR